MKTTHRCQCIILPDGSGNFEAWGDKNGDGSIRCRTGQHSCCYICSQLGTLRCSRRNDGPWFCPVCFEDYRELSNVQWYMPHRQEYHER